MNSSIREREVSIESTSASSSADRAEDVAELRVTHVRMDLRVVADRARREPERVDRPAQVARSIAATSGRPSRMAGSSTWIADDAGGLEIGDLVAQCERDLRVVSLRG